MCSIVSKNYACVLSNSEFATGTNFPKVVVLPTYDLNSFSSFTGKAILPVVSAKAVLDA